MTEQVGITLTVDMSQANREIDRTREKALSLGGAAERLDRASMKAAKGVGAMAPALGAMSRSSSEALRGIGDLAGLIGPGGGLAVGLTLTVGLVVKGYEAWNEYSENAKIAQQSVDAILPGLNRLTDEGLKPAEEAVIRLRKELNALGKEQVQIDRESASANLEQLQKQRESLARSINGGIGVSGEAGARASKILDGRVKKLDEAIAKAQATYDDLVLLDLQTFGRKSEIEANKPGRMAGNDLGSSATMGNVLRERAKKMAEQARKDREDEAEMMWQIGMDEARAIENQREEAARRLADIEKKAADERLRIRESEKKATEDLAVLTRGEGVLESQVRHYESAKLKELAIAIEVEKKKQEETKATAGLTGRVLSETLVTTANVSAALMAADADSRAKLAADLLSAEAVRAGGAISMKGAELVASGTALAIGSLGAMAGPAAFQIGGGLALIGAGAALAAGGPAAIPNVLAVAGMSGAAGASGSGDRGVNAGGGRRRSRSRGDGSETGITQVTINYGVAGPTAEDQARELNRRNLLAERRRFT